MKSFVFIMLTLLVCVACKREEGYVIRGHFPGLKDGMIVRLNQVETPMETPVNLATDTVRDGRFELRGITPSPVFCEIRISNKDLVSNKKEVKNNGTFLFLDNSEIEIKAEHYDSLSYVSTLFSTPGERKARVLGGKLQDEFNAYREILLPLELEANIPEDSLSNLRFYKYNYPQEEYARRYERLYPQVIASQKKVEAARMDFIRQHPASPLSLYLAETLINTEFRRTENEIKELTRIAQQINDTVRGPRFKKKIERAQFQFTGAKYSDLNLETPEGKKSKLSDHIRSGCYTIVDFWASWCGPCKAAIPMVKQLHNRYNRQQLNVVSVSVDEKENDWLKSLEKENMPWTQLRAATDESMRELSLKYNLRSIPRLIIINPAGKIIFSSYDAEALRIELETLLQ